MPRPASCSRGVAQLSRTKVSSVVVALDVVLDVGRISTRSVRPSPVRATRTPVPPTPGIVMLATNEPLSIRPLPSQYTPEYVSRAASTPASLDFDVTVNRTNSAFGVTQRHSPATVPTVNASDAVSGEDGSAARSAEPLEHPVAAHNRTTTDIQRFIPPPGRPDLLYPRRQSGVTYTGPVRHADGTNRTFRRYSQRDPAAVSCLHRPTSPDHVIDPEW